MRFAAVVALALLCSACSTMNSVEALVTPPDPATQLPALETRIFEIVQQERHKIDPKAKVLRIDEELVQVARRRSTDMATKNYLEHKNPDGVSAATIIMDEDANFQGILGEDIAAQHYRRAGFNVERFAHRFVDAWLASPKHKENLAYATYDRTGIGAAINGDTIYVTQLFASDLGLPPPNGDDRAVKELSDPSSGTDVNTGDAPLRGAIIPGGGPPQPSPSN